MSTNNDKAETSTQNGAGGSAAIAKTDSTISAKAAARKKQQQQKNQKANPPAAKKKQPPVVVKPSFNGIATGGMKGTVIAQGDGNLAGQFREFQKKLAGAAAEDKAYGLDSAILDLVAKKRTDFVKPKPDPTIHSNLVPEVDADGDNTGGYKLVCFDPALKEQMDAEYNMDLKFQSSNWNQYGRHQEGYFRTAMGNIDSDVITYCRMDPRMKTAEDNTDLVMLLLVLRSVCAQNHGAVKVDEEYHNLASVHSAAGFKQKKTVSNSAFADEVLDRYESAVFTSGKFVFGQAVYDRVLSSQSSPMTFKQYINASNDKQDEIDRLVKERTVARLIIKNSLNNRARNELSETYSMTNDKCYPNNVSEALSLLATFKNTANNNHTANVTPPSGDDAVVSYHESNNNTNDKDVTSNDVIKENDPIDNKGTNTQVTFDESVMAAVIAEATMEAENEQFFGANFEQLQDVEDAFKIDEPDIVICAHIIDTTEEIKDNNVYPNHHHDFEMILYHTSQRINNVSDVYTVSYNPDRLDMISYQYDFPTPESIIDYSDTMRMKFKLAGIHDSTDLMNIFTDHNDSEAAAIFKQQLNDVDQKGMKVSTIKLLREETIRNLQHVNYNVIRYEQMEFEIGKDEEMKSFPKASILLHHVVSAVSINQQRRKPNRWVNKVTAKLIECGIHTIEQLEGVLDSNALNNVIGEHKLPRLHQVTIHGFQLILGTADFRQGRS
jgi:hypothetical protein